MLAWDVQTQSYMRLSKQGGGKGRAWTEAEDRVLRERDVGMPWSATLDLLSGRSQEESKRRLKFLRRQDAGPATAPGISTLDAVEQESGPHEREHVTPEIATPLAFDFLPQFRLARHWSEEALRQDADAAARSTCEASYRSLRFSAEIVARAWPAGPCGETLYSRWVAPLDEWLRSLETEIAEQLRKSLWEWCDHASFMAT